MRSYSKEDFVHATIILVFLIVVIWIFIRKNILEGYETMESDGVEMKIYNDVTDGGIPYENTIFVSGIHDYYPPFSRVVQSGDKIYMPIHNSRKNYIEQMNKFR